jgi:hypothetical protein
MISLGGLVNQKAFGKFEMGKVISNPFANAFIKEGEDHEVSMGQNQLDTIIKMATELKAKMGENEKEIPAWIQDHISKAENYISQAAGNYHEYGTNESANEAKYNFGKDSAPGEWVAYLSMTRGKKLLKTFNTARGAKQYLSKNVDKLLSGANVESVGIMTKKQWDEREAKYAIEGVNEAPVKSTGEKIQNLNNRIKGLKDKMAATKSSEQKNLIQQRLKNALQTLSNYKKQNISKESIGEAMSAKTPKIFVKTAAVEKKIKELMADRKKAVVPYNSETDPAKKEKLKQVLIKLTNQIKGYEKNLIQLRDMEEEYLQQLHSDAELDTTGL